MIKTLPKYYSIAAINNIDEALLEKRTIAINRIIEMEDPLWLMDCIRYYLGQPLKSKDFTTKFYTYLNEADSFYLNETDDLEKRILAGVIIEESIKTRDEKSFLALALKTAKFGIPDKDILNPEIIDNAMAYLETTGNQIRNNVKKVRAISKQTPIPKEDTEDHFELIKSVASHAKSLQSNIEDRFDQMNNRISVLEEESNIHWWLFRSFSKKSDLPFAKVSSHEAVFHFCAELYDMLNFSLLPSSTEEFLKKAFNEVKDKNDSLSIIDLISNFYPKSTNTLDQVEQIDVIHNLAPIHLAYRRCVDNDGDPTWSNLIGKILKTSIDEKHTRLTLALQLIEELALFGEYDNM